MKQLLLLLALISPSFAQLPSIDYAGMFFQVSSAQPIRKVASLPATCTAVGAASSSNAVLYQGRVYQCTSTNTWTFAVGQSAALTAGRLPYVGTGGILADSANATLDSSGNLVAWGTVNFGNASAGVARYYFVSATAGLTGFRFSGINSQFILGFAGTSVNYYDGDTTYWRSGNGGTTFVTLASSSLAATVPVIQSGTPQTLSGPGAVNLTTYSTLVVTTGANALTLAAGSEGQYKFIRMKTDGGDGTLTVTNLQGGTTITFDTEGDFVQLFYQDAKWHIIVNSGCTVA